MARRLVSVVTVLLSWCVAPAAGGHFVASLHSNFVVNLDFGTDSKILQGDETCPTGGCKDAAAESQPEGETKVMAFAGGKRKFRCTLPSRRNGTGTAGQTSILKDRSMFEAHFRAAKLSPLKGRCWAWRKDYWTYEVCFGRKIVQFNKEASMSFSLGEHTANQDSLLPSGGVSEWYAGGTDNRSTEIHYICGHSGRDDRSFTIAEYEPMKYKVTVTGPQFCAWKGDGLENKDEAGSTLKVSALLEDMRGGCINTTQGWWTYEYCFPDTLRQYHIQGTIKDPMHTLGTLNGTKAVIAVNEVNVTMVRPKQSAANPRERRSAPSNHRVLSQYLPGGAVCDETGRARSATIHFHCPSNWETKSETKFMTIQEGQLCEYQVVIHTDLICGHRKLVPTLPRGKEVIKCSAEPEVR